jgi:LysR family glycine cleavage system transcriptional activator
MAYQLPHLTWLRAFEAAARHSTFTGAATELNRTQSAVSHQVRSLEGELCFKLFERLPHGLRLTDMGRAYLPAVRKAFTDLAVSTAGLFGTIGARPVTVRAPVSYAALVLAPRLTQFAAAHPGIDIRLCSAVWADALTGEDIDVEIRLGSGHWPGFGEVLLCKETALPVCAPAFLKAHGPIREIADFLEKPLIHIIGFEDLWVRLFQAEGLSPGLVKRGFKVDTSLAAIELAAAGQGCAMLLKSFCDSASVGKRLVAPLKLEVPVEESHYLLIADKDENLRPEVIIFREWMMQNLRADQPLPSSENLAPKADRAPARA